MEKRGTSCRPTANGMACEMTGAPSERYAKLVVCGAKEGGWLVKASQMVDGDMEWDG